ncbi:MAG: hypothetical protein HZC01_01540 [Candidatus Kerfeldbacteria bacterium]|nr:hypothetical protein [Candidatus Kerfeldbacteria bacterium]
MSKEKKRYFQGMEHLQPATTTDGTATHVPTSDEVSDKLMRKQIRHDLIWVIGILLVLFIGLAVIMEIDRNSNLVNNWAHTITELFVN